MFKQSLSTTLVPYARMRGSLAALGMVVLMGCDSPSPPTAITMLSTVAGSRLDDAAWSEPTNLGTIVNSAFADFDPSISKDGLSLYFTAGPGRGGQGLRDIWVARRARVDNPWEAPQNLGAVINTAAHESKPTLSVDGHHLYFASNRPGGFGNFDLYVSRRKHKYDDFGWEAPVNLGSVINSASNEESGVTLFEEDETGVVTMYFASQRPGLGGTDIYASLIGADGTFGPVHLVAELSTSSNDTDPSIRRDGLEMFLASNRSGTHGASDLWVARRASTSEPWSAPVNLGPLVNTPPRDPSLEQANDMRPWLSFDGTTLYFNSAFRAGNVSDMFDLWVTTRSKK